MEKKSFYCLIVVLAFIIILIGCSASNVDKTGIKEIRPPKTGTMATVHGKITNIPGSPLEADVKIVDLSNGTVVGLIRSNEKDGLYSIDLPLGKNYGCFIEKKSFFPISQNIDLENKEEAADMREDIVLFSIEEMKNKDLPITINNIFFETSKAALKPESFTELNRLANILQGIPGIKVEIAGHTDNTGRADYNLDLSKKRAQAVVDYLIEKGCEKYSLTSKGYGKTKPIAPNDTDENRAKNRRVEFRILK